MNFDELWTNDDRDFNNDRRIDQQPVKVVPEELDDAYAHEYFHKFETNPNYDRNEYDASYKSIRAVRKYCQERGLPYVRHNGHQKAGRQIKEACGCRKLCHLKFPDDLRTKLLNNLLELSASAQKAFLICHIESLPPNHDNQKKSYRHYYFPSNSGRVKICRLMFTNTYDLTDKSLRTLNRKAESGAFDDLIKELMPKASAASSEQDESCSEVDPNETSSFSYLNPNEYSIGMDVNEAVSTNPDPDESEYSKPRGGSFTEEVTEDDSDVDLVQSQETYDQADGQLEPFSNEDFLERYFYQLYGISATQEEKPSSSLYISDTPSEPCSCAMFHCFRWFTEDLRQKVYNYYNRMTHAKQIQFLKDHTQRVSRKRPKKETSRRNFSQLYLIPTPNGKVKVCRVMFLNTLRINEYKVRSVMNDEDLSDPPTKTSETTQNEDNSKRKTSIFAFDPTLKDPLSLTDTDFPPSKKQKFSTQSKGESNSGNARTIPKTKPKKIVPREEASSHSDKGGQILSTNEDDGAASNTACGRYKPLQPPEAELDDTFLNEYFVRYETSDDQAVTIPPNVRRTWVQVDESGPAPLPCACYRNCSLAYPDDARVKLLSRFVKLTSINQQRFLYRHIRVHRKLNASTRVQKTWFYYLPSKQGLVKVCVVMFTNLFKVTEKKLRGLVKRKFLRNFPDESNQSMDEEDELMAGCSKPRNARGIALNDTDVHQPFAANPSNLIPNIEYSDDEDVEVNYSYDLVKIEPQDESEVNNAHGESFSYSALSSMLEHDGQDQSMSESMLTGPVIDDDFLDEYFVQFEINSDHRQVNGRKIKPMTSTMAADENIVMEPCTCVNFKCFTWLTDDLRAKIYSRFFRLFPLSQKRFLLQLIRKEPTKRFKKVSRRSFSMFYYMPTRRGQIKVCKVMFMNTFKVTDKKLRTLLMSDIANIYAEEQASEPGNITETGDESSYLHTPQSALEPPSDIPDPVVDPIITDVKVEPGFTFDDCNTNNISEQTEHTEDYSTHSSSIVGCFSGGETDQNRPMVYFDDAFIDGYFAPYEVAMDKVIYKARKQWIKADANSALLQPCQCMRICNKIYPDDLRLKIFERFSKLPAMNQRSFLYHHIRSKAPDKRKEDSRKRKVCVHFLPANPVPVRVCRKLFMNTFQVTEKKLRLLMEDQYKHIFENDIGHAGIMPDDDSNLFAMPSDGDDEQVEDLNDLTPCTELPNDLPPSPITGSSMEDLNQPTVTAVELDEAFLNGYFQGFLNNSVADEPERRPPTKKDATNYQPLACSQCPQQCDLKYPVHLRQMIYKKYAELSDINQIHFVESLIKVNIPQLKEAHTNQPVCHSYTYYLPSNAGRIKVCVDMFKNTFKLKDVKKLEQSELHRDSSVEIKLENPIEELNEMIVGE